MNALLMAVWRRQPTDEVMVYSDQGSQFSSYDWRDFLAAHGLVQAILIYRSSNAGGHRAYASVHQIYLDEGRPVIQAGKPITPRAVLNLGQALSANASHSGYIPENVLYADGEALV